MDKGETDKDDRVETPDGAPAKPARSGDSVGEVVKTVFYALLIAMLIRVFLFQPFNIPSGSMLPTLLVGDYVFVSKYAYGYSRFSLPWGPELFDGRIFESAPERGDVAVFRLPTDTSKDYIKRIVGLPGDRLQVIGGVLHINGKAVMREPAGSFADKGRFGEQRQIAMFRETLPDGRSYLTLDEGLSPADNTPVYEVPEGHYFAMGDNRDNSQDSRFLSAVGFIPAENLVGRAEIIFFSLDGETRFWEVWKWPFNLRFSRFFDGVG
ncbi:signal peptidase I [Futiania mangrovi]|uniref:Signal peptidase I n=1 Tax=Futiania mangrovi TaxID=2959716 RepID=A0A9J6PEC4_9PROT|nr:signal peptidase I [Futiania mangrovii]MCP1336107.1 signal peptidase I [Futiania mangrovii]